MTSVELRFVLAVSWSAVGFAAYYFLSGNPGLARRAGAISRRFDLQGKQVLLQRLLGLLILGFVSLLLILVLPGVTPTDYGLGFSFQNPPPWWSFLFIPLILVLGFYAAKKESNLELYPQIRARTWTPAMIATSGVTWVAFLLGYEFLFRGFLLQASLDTMGQVPAIALNCALYALAHVYKGPGETFGAIPVGVLFCYLTILTGNIWCAVILHSVMALSNEWYSLRFHPNMDILKAV